MKGAPIHGRSGVSPGGPAVSAAKRRRLAALEGARGQQPQPQGAASAAGRGAAGTSAAASAPEGQQQPRGGLPAPGDFPYNPLGDIALDGSLSAALALAKAAAAAPAAGATAAAPTARTAGGQQSQRAPSSSTAAAATAAAAGDDSMAAEVLAQLMATNPRASGGDLCNLLAQRLQNRSVLLDNPTAMLKASKLFARRNSSYSAKLRSNVSRRATQPQLRSMARSAPSYQTMLRIHQLWRQYTSSLTRSSAASPGGASSDPNGAAASIAEQLGSQLDMHGALVTVVQHRNPQLVGISGVVLRHSTTALHVVAPDNRLRVVPLKGGVVQYAVDGTSLQLAS